MQDNTTTLETLKIQLKKFVDERDWNQFHSPKNMSMGIAIEAAELMEHFLWSDAAQSFEVLEKKRQEIEHEVADIAVFVLMFCAENNIDLSTAIEQKMALNAEKYSVEKSKGKSTKYTEL